VPDVVAQRNGDFEIEPEANHGVRLVLRPPVLP
jgi:hypothetical protein